MPPLYQPSELRLFLRQQGIFPNQRLSQHFLIDGNIIRKIVAVSDVQSDDTLLEIGPGPGSLTEALLHTGAHVMAVEKDPLLAKALQRLQTPTQQLAIFCHDVLTFPLEQEISSSIKEGKRAKVIANLPYHLTTPIIARLVVLRELFSTLTLMVQEEVARRFIAQPNTAEYSSFSLFLRFYTTVYYAFGVSRNCFYPSPNVDSAIVIFRLREPPLTEEEAVTFFQLTRTAFKQRRKMLRASLKELFPSQRVEEALLEIGLNPLGRPEALSLEHFLQLHALLIK